MRIMIACGGTGGHLLPGLAVAESLLERGHTVRMLVSEKAVDQTALKALHLDDQHGKRLSVCPISAIGYTGVKQMAKFGAHLAKATRDCATLCTEFAPDVTLGMGGFTSAPAVLASRWKHATVLIHESNAIPGKANRLVGQLAHHIALGLADCAKFFGSRPVTVTGTPIRAALRRGKVADAYERLGLKRGRHTVLVVGGSQGAHAINDTIASALPWLDTWTDRVQFVHLSGAKDEAFAREAYERNGFNAKVMGFCSEMELAYSAADLVISRAGAATLTEIAAFGLPAILIPYPHAGGNHQTHNASVFERAGAARLIEQADLGHMHVTMGERLAEIITNILDDDERRQRMAAAAQVLAVLDAQERIADLIEGCAERKTISCSHAALPVCGKARRQSAAATTPG